VIGVADLVEEQRAAIGRDQVAVGAVVGAGVRVAPGAEQQALGDPGRDRGSRCEATRKPPDEELTTTWALGWPATTDTVEPSW
jgi:hypothetical protein